MQYRRLHCGTPFLMLFDMIVMDNEKCKKAPSAHRYQIDKLHESLSIFLAVKKNNLENLSFIEKTCVVGSHIIASMR